MSRPKKVKEASTDYDMLIDDPDNNRQMLLAKVKREKGSKLKDDWTLITFLKGGEWIGVSEVRNSHLIDLLKANMMNPPELREAPTITPPDVMPPAAPSSEMSSGKAFTNGNSKPLSES
jgi:hypothetical protein